MAFQSPQKSSRPCPPLVYRAQKPSRTTTGHGPTSGVGQNHQQNQTGIYAISDQELRGAYSVFKRPWGQNPSEIMASCDDDKRMSSIIISTAFKGDIRESERFISATERPLSIDAYRHYASFFKLPSTN
ncbi:hypothetical protein O181_034807 [Austropuccinia psidii MF-1]|uniref:Uncharacterized protein n=1 Tax=Austropuccinia psidii MF-1 TaxID=1389203 RepID=A0A9Q3D7E1_9BASI|nr:hypothetical protein [Austropuccinia psidii MF-1]